MQSASDSFRPVVDLLKPDPRFDFYGVTSQAELHADVADLNLNATVPDDVAIQFDTARNLFVYSWYSARFIQVAQRHAYSAVEFAFKMVLGEEVQKQIGKRRLTLGDLIEKAASKPGLLRPEKFRHFHRVCEANSDRRDEIEHSFVREQLEIIREFRNRLSHGTSMLVPAIGSRSLEICCDIIKQLFPEKVPPVS